MMHVALRLWVPWSRSQSQRQDADQGLSPWVSLSQVQFYSRKSQVDICAGISSFSNEMFRVRFDDRIFLVFAVDFLERSSGVAQVHHLTTELQKIAKNAGHERPLLIGIDQENGMCDLYLNGHELPS